MLCAGGYLAEAKAVAEAYDIDFELAKKYAQSDLSQSPEQRLSVEKAFYRESVGGCERLMNASAIYKLKLQNHGELLSQAYNLAELQDQESSKNKYLGKYLYQVSKNYLWMAEKRFNRGNIGETPLGDLSSAPLKQQYMIDLGLNQFIKEGASFTSQQLRDRAKGVMGWAYRKQRDALGIYIKDVESISEIVRSYNKILNLLGLELFESEDGVYNIRPVHDDGEFWATVVEAVTDKLRKQQEDWKAKVAERIDIDADLRARGVQMADGSVRRVDHILY